MSRPATIRYSPERLNESTGGNGDSRHGLGSSNLLLLVLMVLIVVALAVANFNNDLPQGEPVRGWVQP